jgi:hypothetical protein
MHRISSQLNENVVANIYTMGVDLHAYVATSVSIVISVARLDLRIYPDSYL